MAITFSSQLKKQRILFWSVMLFMILALLLAIFIIFPLKIGGKPAADSPTPINPDFQINFDILNSDKVKNLKPFAGFNLEIEKTGRIEPFLPYYK